MKTYPNPYQLLLASVKAQQIGQWDVKDLKMIQSVLSADEAEVNASKTDEQSASGEGVVEESSDDEEGSDNGESSDHEESSDDEENSDAQSIDEPNTTKLWHTLLKLLPVKLADLVALRTFYLEVMPWAFAEVSSDRFIPKSVRGDDSKDKAELFEIALNTALYAFESFCQLFRRDITPCNNVSQNDSHTTPEVGIVDDLRWRVLQRTFPQCFGRSRDSSMACTLLRFLVVMLPMKTQIRVVESTYSPAFAGCWENVVGNATYKGLRHIKNWYEDTSTLDVAKFYNEVDNIGDFFFTGWWDRVQELMRRLGEEES